MADSQAAFPSTTSTSSPSSSIVAQGSPPPPWTAPGHGCNNTGFSFPITHPLLETTSSMDSTAPAFSTSMLFGAAPPSAFGPCPPPSSLTAPFGSFGAAPSFGWPAPHIGSSPSSTGCSFLATPIGGASSTGFAFGSSFSPFSSWQSSPFGAALPSHGVGHGAMKGCNSSFQGWSGPPLASSLTSSFASHDNNNQATGAPAFWVAFASLRFQQYWKSVSSGQERDGRG